MPETFGRYTLLERLGYGGMAEVFLAQTRGVGGFEKVLAIKRLLPHCIEDQQTVDLLADEAKITVQLTHPNIVQVFDFGRVDDSYFIAMEYVDGVDLKTLVQIDDEHSHPMPQDVALHVVISALEGLDFAHKRKDDEGESFGIIHRDVSPHNLLISRHGQVKLTDFGVARARISSHVSVVGDIRGKFSYMPPEQAVGGEIDQRVDVFAAGAILYELLSGRQPYRSTSSGEQIKLLTGKIAPPSEMESDVPASLDAITLKALAKDPAQRYATAEELAAALRGEFDRLEKADRLSAQQRLAEMVERRAEENERAKNVKEPSRLMVSINEHDKTFGDSLIFRPQQASGEVGVHKETGDQDVRFAPSVSFGDAVLAQAASITSRRSRDDAPTEVAPIEEREALAYAETRLFGPKETLETETRPDEEEDETNLAKTLIQDNPLYSPAEDSPPLAEAPTRVEIRRRSRSPFGAGLTSGEIKTVVQRTRGARIESEIETEDDEAAYEATTLQDHPQKDDPRFSATVEMEPELVRAAKEEAARQRKASKMKPSHSPRPRRAAPTPQLASNTPPAVRHAERAQVKLDRQRDLLGAYITIALAVAIGLGVALLIATW